MGNAPLVSEILPGLADELARSLAEQGRRDLAEQIPGLRVRAVCPCEVEGCGSFSTALPMKRWFRRGKLVPVGDLVVNTIDGTIVFVEVLGRPDVSAALDGLER
jgi:hypothetical protein